MKIIINLSVRSISPQKYLINLFKIHKSNVFQKLLSSSKIDLKLKNYCTFWLLFDGIEGKKRLSQIFEAGQNKKVHQRDGKLLKSWNNFSYFHERQFKDLKRKQFTENQLQEIKQIS